MMAEAKDEERAVSSVRGAFDPETIAVLSAIFDEACLALPPGRHTPAMRCTLAEGILRKAGEGERDPVRLRTYALLQALSARQACAN
jgi:hypothetical protein